MSKERLTGKRAVWFGLLGTPVLLVAAITLLGVTAGSAGPSTAARATTAAQATPASALEIVKSPNTIQKTKAEILAYWTPERMAQAQEHPLSQTTAASPTAEGSMHPIQSPGSAGLAVMRPDGSVDVQTVSQQSTGALTEPFHNTIPYTQWQWFGRYLRNVPAGSPNRAISAVHKVFFSQDDDGNGVASNFVCSSSSIGLDAVWTAGHCVNNGIADPGNTGADGLNNGWSFNTLFCPSYDSAQGGVNPTAGCWTDDDGLVAYANWTESDPAGPPATPDFDFDFGAADDPGTGSIPANGTIGAFTLPLGLAWNWGNVAWVSFGYPLAAPFTGGKIETCASSLGYTDNGGPTAPDSVAMGCDMTGGTSGGPWIFQFGRPGQPGGGGGNFLNGHNSWRHTAEPEELNTPYFDCRAVILYNFINDTTVACP